MNNIPNDPIMLLSFINMKLRDNYSSFENLCEGMDISADEITEKLSAAGFYTTRNRTDSDKKGISPKKQETTYYETSEALRNIYRGSER